MRSRQAAKAISFLWVGSLLGAGSAFLTQIILAHQLGPGSFGTFAAALTTVTLLAPLAGFGISQFWLKAFGLEGRQATRWLSPSFHFVEISTISVLLVLVAWGVIGPHDRQMRVVLLPLSLFVLGQVASELVSSKLQLEEHFFRLGLWQLIPHVMRLSLVAILAFGFPGSMNGANVAWAYAFVSICLAIIGAIQLTWMIRGPFDLAGGVTTNRLAWASVTPVKAVISEAWPFGLAGLFQMIYYQSDIILVKYITGADAAGIYNVAFTVMVGVYLLPTVIFQKYLMPKIHRWANHDRIRFRQVYRQGNTAMFILGIIAMSGIWLTAPWAIPFLFGKQYEGSIALLNILAVSAPIIFVAMSVGATLTTREHMKKKVLFMGAIALVNTGLNLTLIPSFGAMGAAGATVCSNLLLLSAYYIFAQKVVFGLRHKNMAAQKPC